MNWPVKKVYITQDIGENPDVYSRFGLKGHNGIDLRIFDDNGNKSTYGKLLSPHDGKIIEAYNDSDGYGWYYKIENDVEGSILGHNKELYFKVGDFVKEGQEIAITDNTGWSTGSHVHWLYYRNPRDRSNGFGGAIDPRPYIKNMNQVTLDSDKFEELVTKSSKYDEFQKAGYPTVEHITQLLQDMRNNIDGLKRERDVAKTELEQRRKEYNAFIATLANDDHLQTRQDENEIISKSATFGAIDEELQDLKVKYSDDRKSFALTEQELNAEIARLKALLSQQNVIENSETKALIKELIRRLYHVLDFAKKG